jgi:hypothetical protein
MIPMTNDTNGRALAAMPRGGALTPSLLGGATYRSIPTGGRIRSGIQVLTPKAADVQEARSLYEDGVAQGRSFEAIGRDITARCPDLTRPLRPKNVPYFTVRGEDFPNPEIARRIMDRYAEDKGDGVKRLYRFPVIFPADAWQNVMPHELAVWTHRERKFWSEYSEDGQTRYCMTHRPVPVSNGKRTVRLFGGRKAMLRPDNNGVCEPEACPEYQAGNCGLAGRFIFFMPGIESLDAFDLPTRSFYAMQAAIQKFQAIAFMRGGRISGFLDGRRTPFYITKRLLEVSMIGDDGQAKRVSQWIIELEAPIDVTSLLQPDDGVERLEHRAQEATAILEGRSNQAPKVDKDGVIDMGDAFAAPGRQQAGSAASVADDARPAERSAPEPRPSRAEPERPAARAPAPSTPTPQHISKGAATDKTAAAGDVAWIVDAAGALGISPDRFEQYADKRWGKGWKLAAGGRKRALDEVTLFADNGPGYQEKVRAELEVFS